MGPEEGVTQEGEKEPRDKRREGDQETGTERRRKEPCSDAGPDVM